MTFGDEEQAEEASLTDLARQHFRVLRPPVGGGDFKGALPGGHASNNSPRSSVFEDCMVEALLVQVFMNLSLEVSMQLVADDVLIS